MVREETLTFGDDRVQVREVGAGPPVLLVNGIGAHTAMWQVLEEALTGFRVMSFDAPGSGRSSLPRNVTSVRRLAELATHVLDHFGVEQADAIGYSMGGAVLQQLCADAPDRIRRAALVATSPGIGAVYSSVLALLNVGTPLRYLSHTLYRLTIPSLAGGRARTDPEWVATVGAVRLKHRPSIRGYCKQLAAMSVWSGFPVFDRIHQPVLVVAGEDDPLTPVVNGMIIAHLVPNGRLLQIHDEGHLMLLDRSSKALGPVREFLEAESLDRSEVWTRAVTVSADDLDAALVKKQLQIMPLPFGPISSYQRHRWLSRPRQSDADIRTGSSRYGTE